MNSRAYETLLVELGFHNVKRGRKLRHVKNTATLYFNRTRDGTVFFTAYSTDSELIDPELWQKVPPKQVKDAQPKFLTIVPVKGKEKLALSSWLAAPRRTPGASPSERKGNVAEAQLVRYWWVNHSQTSGQEIAGEYLWSPKREQNGANNESYNNMTRVRPGDVVFSFANASVGAIGVVIGAYFEAPTPVEFGPAGRQWGQDSGWQVPVKFTKLKVPLQPKQHAAALAPSLPAKYSPIRANGEGNQKIYLASVPDLMVAALCELLGGQIEVAERAVMMTAGSEVADEIAAFRLQQRTDIGATEKTRLIRARRGQGIYRQNLELVETCCRITAVTNGRHLRASHIKPWRDSDDREKLDGFNGLMLAPHIDHLFDRGYISFADSGDLLISSELDVTVLDAWNLNQTRLIKPFRSEQSVYLAHHRKNIFITEDSANADIRSPRERSTRG